MYKIIDLGFEVPDTGERRVSLLDPGFTKIASSDIQRFWDSLERKPNCSYLWVIGVSAVEYYGCNNNGDAFTEQDLRDYHHTFVDNAHVFLHHVNRDPKKSIGKPVYSYYNDVMHRVEIIMEIDKTLESASETVGKIKNGDPIYVSMGCNVAHDVCSICGNKAKTRATYCDHLKYNMKKILSDGRQVFAYNPNPKFFDISIVRKPADPTAYTLDKVASYGGSSNHELSSAELGEQAMVTTEKLAAIKKVSDIIKQVDGQITDMKDDDGVDYNILRTVAKKGFEDFDYPDFDFKDLMENNVEPCDLIRGLASSGAPITLGDMAYMGGRSYFGENLTPNILSSIIHMLPAALRLLQHSPMSLMDAAAPIFSRHSESPAITIRIIQPVAAARIRLFSKMASEEELKKAAAEIPGITMPTAIEVPYERLTNGRYQHYFSNVGPGNLRSHMIIGADGKEYHTNRGQIRNGFDMDLIENIFPKLIGAGLSAAAAAAILADPTKLEHIIAGVVSGTIGLKLMRTKNERTKDTFGNTLPADAYFYKKASAPISKLTYAGMALPGALGLDYLYNKWKYKDYDPEMFLTAPGKVLHRAGKFVTDHPVTSTLTSGLAGALLANKMKLRLPNNP